MPGTIHSLSAFVVMVLILGGGGFHLQAEPSSAPVEDPFARFPLFVGPPKPTLQEDVMPTPKLLARAREKALVTCQAAECYRLLMVPTFANPVCLRLEKTAAGARLFAKRWEGKGGYDWKGLAESQTVDFDEAQYHTFVELLNKSAFWTEPFDDPGAEGFDGTSWTLEGRDALRYRALDRPNLTNFHADTAKPWLWLLQQSKLSLPKETE